MFGERELFSNTLEKYGTEPHRIVEARHERLVFSDHGIGNLFVNAEECRRACTCSIGDRVLLDQEVRESHHFYRGFGSRACRDVVLVIGFLVIGIGIGTNPITILEQKFRKSSGSTRRFWSLSS